MDSSTVVHGNPGCGKSYNLIRICGEYASKGARVLLLSHTKVAAAELKERITENKDQVHTSTIHAMVYGLVGVDKNQVVTRQRLVEFGKDIGVDISGDFDINGEQERVIEEGDEAMSIIGRADACCADRSDEYEKSNKPLPRATYNYVSKAYDAWKKANQYIDFTDMLLMYTAYPSPIQYDILIVDEAQDLSKAQWNVVEQMATYVQHVVISGDVDQQLFTWGGSDRDGMHTFADKHSSEVYSLPQSYRIPHSVHRLAMGIRDKFSSKLDTTYKPRDVEGIVESHAAPLGVQYDDRSTLVLYRTHSLRRDIEQDLMDKYVPFTVLNGFRDPWHSSFGNAVAAFNLIKEGETITARQKNTLERYCRVTNINRTMSWDKYLTIPDRFIDYMLRTEGMEATVKLSTIHGAKGMEAEHVVLYAGITQRVQDGMAYDADAEHKVFYVGATRAKHRLDIVAGELNYEIQIPKRKL